MVVLEWIPPLLFESREMLEWVNVWLMETVRGVACVIMKFTRRSLGLVLSFEVAFGREDS